MSRVILFSPRSLGCVAQEVVLPDYSLLLVVYNEILGSSSLLLVSHRSVLGLRMAVCGILRLILICGWEDWSIQYLVVDFATTFPSLLPRIIAVLLGPQLICSDQE